MKRSLLELLETEDKLVKNIRFSMESYEDFKYISYSIANDYKEIAEKGNQDLHVCRMEIAKYLDGLQKLVKYRKELRLCHH